MKILHNLIPLWEIMVKVMVMEAKLQFKRNLKGGIRIAECQFKQRKDFKSSIQVQEVEEPAVIGAKDQSLRN